MYVICLVQRTYWTPRRFNTKPILRVVKPNLYSIYVTYIQWKYITVPQYGKKFAQGNMYVHA